jgi:DNA-nicking Smr family endonuclease
MSSADREGRRCRHLSDEEHELWATVTRSVPRLRKKKPKPVSAETADEPKPVAAKANGPNKSKQAAKHAIVPKPAPAAPALAPLERRLKQRLVRGVVGIDSRIDLHGLTQSEAHDALLHFLRSSQIKGAKIVLVITGKGGREHGVLRRGVPLWLVLPEFRQTVVGFEAAGPAHGGEGALYVRVRKLRG